MGYEPGEGLLITSLMVIHAVYHIGFTATVAGTPGKLLLRMRVALPDGSPLRLDTAILRYLVFLLSYLVPFGMLISLAFVLTDPERRSIHDRIAHTLVIVK